MVDFVHYDVIEALRGEPLEVLGAGQLLDGREDDVRIELGAVLREPADAQVRHPPAEHAPERLRRLRQQLAAVRQDEDAERRSASLAQARLGVKGRYECLPEPGRHHDEGTPAFLAARCGKRRESLFLNFVWLRWERQRLVFGFAGRGRQRARPRARRVARYP